jgi:hypothetical protein
MAKRLMNGCFIEVSCKPINKDNAIIDINGSINKKVFNQ